MPVAELCRGKSTSNGRAVQKRNATGRVELQHSAQVQADRDRLALHAEGCSGAYHATAHGCAVRERKLAGWVMFTCQ